MATVNLLPSADVSNDWALSTGATPYALIDDDYTGNIASDSAYLSATAAGKICIVQLQDFTEAHSSIEGIQVVTRAGNNFRGRTFELETKMLPVLGGAYYTEGSGTQAASTTYRTQTYTNRTTYDGSNAWTQGKINALKLSVELDAISGGTTSFTYAYVIVTYIPPVTADNAVFFGCNF